MGFSDRNWNRTVLCWDVRIYVLKLYTKNYSHRLFSFFDNCGFISGVLSEDTCIVVGAAISCVEVNNMGI